MKLFIFVLAGLQTCQALVNGVALANDKECDHDKMPHFHQIIPGLGDPMDLPCNKANVARMRDWGQDGVYLVGYILGLVWMFSGLHIAAEFFWKPSWNALLSFVGLGASAQEMNSDHFATFANCIKEFYICVIATLMTRSSIGISVLVGACVIQVWVISGLAVLFNPDGANLGVVGFDLFKDILFHAASIAGFFLFSGFMPPPKEMKAVADTAAAEQGAETGVKLKTGDYFLVICLIATWVAYTLIVFMENTCCHSCLASGEVEDDQSKKERIEAKAGESVRGGSVDRNLSDGGAIDEENQEYPSVPNYDAPKDEAGDGADKDGDGVVDGLEAELSRAKSISLWTPPESILGKLKYFVTLPFWVLFTFTIPNFRDEEDAGQYREVLWADIFRVFVANFLANFWMVVFAIFVVQWGCIIGAVLDFQYEVVGIVILAVGANFDNLLNAMYCTWTDADTAYTLSEAFAAQVNNFTFTLSFILIIFFLDTSEQMPIEDGLRFCMLLLAGAAVALYVFLRIRGMEATPVLGCLMVEFGVVVAGLLVWVTYLESQDALDLHLTWN